jgi:hypothetical protein
MSKFNEKVDEVLNELRREYLTLAEVEKVFDDTVRSLGLQSWLNGEVNGYDKVADQKMEELAGQVMNAFEKSGVHEMYRDDLINDGYEILVKMADEHNLWRQGHSYGNVNI